MLRLIVFTFANCKDLRRQYTLCKHFSFPVNPGLVRSSTPLHLQHWLYPQSITTLLVFRIITWRGGIVCFVIYGHTGISSGKTSGTLDLRHIGLAFIEGLLCHSALDQLPSCPGRRYIAHIRCRLALSRVWRYRLRTLPLSQSDHILYENVTTEMLQITWN